MSFHFWTASNKPTSDAPSASLVLAHVLGQESVHKNSVWLHGDNFSSENFHRCRTRAFLELGKTEQHNHISLTNECMHAIHAYSIM